MGVFNGILEWIVGTLGILSLFQWIVLFSVFIVYIYWSWTKNYGVYEKQGLFSIPPKLFFGNTKEIVMQTKAFTPFHQDIYKQFGDRKYGIYYDASSPVLYIKDPDLVKQVLVKDFDHFVDFGFMPKEITEMPINELGLVNSVGEKWKSLRASIAPAFSLKNIKSIGTKINAPALDVIDAIGNSPDGEVDMEKLTGHYAIDCIGRIVFSMDFQTIKSNGNEIVTNGDKFFDIWRFFFSTSLPKIARLFNVSVMNPKTANFFISMSENILKGRNGVNSYPNDVLGLMMKIRDQKLDPEENDLQGQRQALAAKLMTDTMISRTLVQFFLDGYDTVRSLLSIVFYLVATHPEVQDRLMAEVDDMVTRVGANITGDDVKELKYLDQVFHESSRIGAVAFTVRRCTKKWTIPGTDVVIPEDMGILIPIQGLHSDPKYFPEPKKFDPDRFSPENKAKIKTGTFLPFGMGPRGCIGMQIAQMEAKILMYHVFRKFHLEPTEKTVIPIKWRVDHFNQIDGGVKLKAVSR